MNKATKPIQAVETTCEILSVLHEIGEAGVSEIADELDLTVSTVHNHVNTLVQEELLVKTGSSYKISYRFLEYGAKKRSQSAIYQFGSDGVDQLAEETGELANLTVEEQGHGVHIYIRRGEQAVHLDTYIGMHVPLHCTASGKAILANLPDERVNKILNQRGLEGESPKTITDEAKLREELETVSERGYALDFGERLPGLRCVAAPIVTPNGGLRGAVSVSGPTSRMTDERISESLPEKVTGVADTIAINMTYDTSATSS